MGTPSLAVVGYASIDRIARPGAPPGETLGGGAVYAALAAARLGVAVSLHVAVGEDFPGTWLGAIEALGIDVSAVRRGRGPTRRARLRYDEAEQRIASTGRDAAWWERTGALFPPIPRSGFDGYLVCPAPFGAVEAVVAAARGRLVVADTSEAFAVIGPAALAAFAGVDVFAPSLDEIRLLSGGERDADRAIRQVAGTVPVLVAKLGRDGLQRVEKGRVIRHAVRPVPAVDPTGAGDGAAGALAASILRGDAPEQQLAAAAEAGRLAVAAVGPVGLGWRSAEFDKFSDFLKTSKSSF